MKLHSQLVAFTLNLALCGCFILAHADDTVTTKFNTPVNAVENTKTYSGGQVQQESKTTTIGNSALGPYEKETRQCGGSSGKAVGAGNCSVVSEESGLNLNRGASSPIIGGSVQGNVFLKTEYSTNKDDPATIKTQTVGASESASVSGSMYGVKVKGGVGGGIESAKTINSNNQDSEVPPTTTKNSSYSTPIFSKDKKEIYENNTLKAQTTNLTVGNSSVGPSIKTTYSCDKVAMQPGQSGTNCPVVGQALEVNGNLGADNGTTQISVQGKLGIAETYSTSKENYEDKVNNRLEYFRAKDGAGYINEIDQPSKVSTVYGGAEVKLGAKVGPSSVPLAGVGIDLKHDNQVMADEEALLIWESVAPAREHIEVMKKFDRHGEFDKLNQQNVQAKQQAELEKQAKQQNENKQQATAAQQASGSFSDVLNIFADVVLQMPQMKQQTSAPLGSASAPVRSGCEHLNNLAPSRAQFPAVPCPIIIPKWQ